MKESELGARGRVRSRRRGGGRGYTLVELVVASSLLLILFAGMQSAVLLAARAIPGSVPVVDLTTVGGALSRVSLDLSYAKKVTLVSATEVVLTVADRDGDAVDDTIRYAWSGVSGEPLLRVFNSAAPEELLAQVKSLTFAPKTESVAGAATYIESSETLLATYNVTPSGAPVTIDTSSWVAQDIPVALPGDGVDYRTTRVRLYMQNSGAATGTTSVELRAMRGQQPTSDVLGVGSIAEASLLSSPNWTSISLASTRYLDRNEQVGVVVRPSATPPSCTVSIHTGSVAASVGAYCTSVTSGGSWSTVANTGMLYELWGVYRTLGTAQPTTRATSVLVSCQAGQNQSLELNVPLANRPTLAP